MATKSIQDDYHARIRSAGYLLAIGAVLIIGGFLLHPEEVEGAAQQLAVVAEHADVWRNAHYAIGIGFVTLAAGIAILLTAQENPFTAGRTGFAGWALALAFVLAALPLFFIEATIIPDAAAAGDQSTYDAFTAYAGGGIAMLGFFLAALTMLAVRFLVVRPDGMARWLGALATVATVAAFLGLVGPVFLGVEQLAPLGLATPVVFALIAAFGIALARCKPAEQAEKPATSPAPA